MTYSPRVNLYETDVTNITEIMAGPWKAIKVVDAAPGETFEFTTDGEEHGVFVIEGSFVATVPDGSTFEFVRDMSMTLASGGAASVVAGPAGFKICQVIMKVD
jgi:hypothetical protein